MGVKPDGIAAELVLTPINPREMREVITIVEPNARCREAPVTVPGPKERDPASWSVATYLI